MKLGWRPVSAQSVTEFSPRVGVFPGRRLRSAANARVLLQRTLRRFGTRDRQLDGHFSFTFARTPVVDSRSDDASCLAASVPALGRSAADFGLSHSFEDALVAHPADGQRDEVALAQLLKMEPETSDVATFCSSALSTAYPSACELVFTAA